MAEIHQVLWSLAVHATVHHDAQLVCHSLSIHRASVATAPVLQKRHNDAEHLNPSFRQIQQQHQSKLDSASLGAQCVSVTLTIDAVLGRDGHET